MFASMKKTKYKIRLENSQTSRAYTVGISQFSSDGNVFLRQIVTEYIGNEESKNIIHNQDSRITKIENDINHINDIVQGFLSKNCIPHSIDNRSAISYFKK